MPRTYIEKGGSLKVRGLQPLRAQVPPIGVSQQVRWAAEVGSEPSPFPPWKVSNSAQIELRRSLFEESPLWKGI